MVAGNVEEGAGIEPARPSPIRPPHRQPRVQSLLDAVRCFVLSGGDQASGARITNPATQSVIDTPASAAQRSALALMSGCQRIVTRASLPSLGRPGKASRTAGMLGFARAWA